MKKETIMFAALIAIAALFRFWALGDTPPGLYPDEAANGNDAIVALQNADWKVFYPANNGREGLFINLQALFMQLFLTFGFTPAAWMLRAPSAAIGVLTVLATLGAAKELFFMRNEAKDSLSSKLSSSFAPWVAAFLIAVSFWHVNFSRIGFRAIMAPLLTTLLVLLLLRARRQNSLFHAILAGMIFGLGFHTYIAFRLVPLLVALFFFADVFSRKDALRAAAKRWAAFGFAFLLIVLPIAGYFLAHPADFLGRAGDVSVWRAQNPLAAFGESSVKTAFMFFAAGDCNWRHNLTCAPQLLFPVSLFFLVGLTIFLRKIIGGAFTRSLALNDMVLPVWLGVGLLPALLSIEALPHALRAIGAIPPAMILSAKGFLFFFDLLKRKVAYRAVLSTVLVMLAFIGMIEFYRYFFIWAGNPHTQGAFRADLTNVARMLNERQNTAARYVIANEIGVPADLRPYFGDDAGTAVPMPVQTIIFLTLQDPSIIYIRADELEKITPAKDRPTLIVPLQFDDRDLTARLHAAFPALTPQETDGVKYWKL